MTTYSLRDLGISPGQSKSEELSLDLPPYHQGGVDFVPEHGGKAPTAATVAYVPVTSPVPARLDITAMTEGTSFRLRFSADYEGPCSRCLEPASWHVDIDVFAVHDEASDDEELRSDHVDDTVHELDVTGWAQEEVGVEFPTQVLCREDCRGLCAQCGVNLNDEPDHAHEQPTDSRWDALKDLQLEETE
ncbi:MAG: DUF177 domain-containing protein [Thermoleophilia bacterium]|nr:DUF177 domain-containing protein [Thermoleophilia bacterium]